MNRHLSSEQIANCLVGEEDAEERRHIAECSDCLTELEELRSVFAMYRESSRNWSAYWMAQPAHPTRRFRQWALAVGLAAVLLAGIWLVRTPPPRDEPFLSIPYVVPAASYERTQVTRMNVPVAALRAAGIAIQLVDAGASVRADVLVGQDGRALAVRLLDRRYN